MRFGLFASVLFHLSILGAIIVWGQDWSRRGDVFVEPVLPVELLTEAVLAERTNIPSLTTEPDEAPEPEPDVPDEPEPLVEPEPVIIEPDVVETPAPPAPPADEPEPEPQPEPEPEPEPEPPKKEPPKPPKKKKPANDGLDLDALADLAKKNKEADAVRDPKEAAGAAKGPANVRGGSGTLTASENAKLLAAMRRCWKPLDGAPNPEKLRVEVSFRLLPDGRLQERPKVLNATQIAISPNRYWKVAEQRAVQAVIECQPYTFFAPERYGEEFILNFTPTLLGRS
ncbi:MAG: hypothetical protein AAFW83_06790 [Pseudomonadota bacterium]